jgi:hypothetical protein
METRIIALSGVLGAALDDRQIGAQLITHFCQPQWRND